MKRLLVRLAWLLNSFVVLSISPWVNASSEYNMTQGVTEISGQVYELHMLIFYICCAIAFVVFGVMFYSILRHRKSKGAVAAHFHESTKVEILWTIIPIIILIAMAIPATKTLIAMEDTSQSELTVKITGSQWKWHYSYFGEDVEFFSLLATSDKEIEGIEVKALITC
ncbi:cytochrome c oxidase, subunit II [Vibrionales bacterium SWAT-3]|nr:cytochrome c oxidase, subunit II [Vibrionales bacterium SWAT-3]